MDPESELEEGEVAEVAPAEDDESQAFAARFTAQRSKVAAASQAAGVALREVKRCRKALELAVSRRKETQARAAEAAADLVQLEVDALAAGVPVAPPQQPDSREPLFGEPALADEPAPEAASRGLKRAGESTVRLWVHFAQGPPPEPESALLAAFGPWAAQCAHWKPAREGKPGVAAVHLACSPEVAACAAAQLTNSNIGGSCALVHVAPEREQTVCGTLRCPMGGGKLLRIDAPAEQESALPLRTFCFSTGGVASAAGLLQPQASSPHAPAAVMLLNTLPEAVQGYEIRDVEYAAAMLLASHAASDGECVLAVVPRDADEQAVCAALPSAMAVRLAVEEEGAWRVSLRPLRGAPVSTRERLLCARLCELRVLRAWQRQLHDRRLSLGLDLDETVVRSYRLGDLVQEEARLRATAAAASLAASQTAWDDPGRPVVVQAAGDARRRAAAAAAWVAHLTAFSTTGVCDALRQHSVAAATFAPGASYAAAAALALPHQAAAMRRYTAYHVPAGSPDNSLGCDACLCRVAGESLLVFVRPGWPAFRDVLRRRFWTVVATHGTLDYAATIAALLDPSPQARIMLRAGGEDGHAEWVRSGSGSGALRLHGQPEAAAPPVLEHIASFRREQADAENPLIQKSFCAFRAVQPAHNAFVALDDLVGGRTQACAVWAAPDVRRVLCPPPFRPFAPREPHVLQKCGDALAAVHEQFFARFGPDADAQADDGTGGDEAARSLEAAVTRAEAQCFPAAQG